MQRTISKYLVIGDQLKQSIEDGRPKQIELSEDVLREEALRLNLKLKREYDFAYPMGNRPLNYELSEEGLRTYSPRVTFFKDDKVVIDYAVSLILSNSTILPIEEFKREINAPKNEFDEGGIIGASLIYVPYVINQRTLYTWHIHWERLDDLFIDLRKPIAVIEPIKIVDFASLSKGSQVKLLALESEAAEFGKLFQ